MSESFPLVSLGNENIVSTVLYWTLVYRLSNGTSIVIVYISGGDVIL